MKVLLIRHGEPEYKNVKELNLVSYLGELTPNGVMQAEEVADNDILKDAELIISSPFTRALQTAAIISRKTNIPLTVEPALHEWLKDTTHHFTLDPVYGKAAYHEFYDNNCERNFDCVYTWESASHIANRVYPAIRKYYEKGYKKIIVVAHAIILRTFGYSDQDIPHCHIHEYEFDENSCYKGITPWRG